MNAPWYPSLFFSMQSIELVLSAEGGALEGNYTQLSEFWKTHPDLGKQLLFHVLTDGLRQSLDPSQGMRVYNKYVEFSQFKRVITELEKALSSNQSTMKDLYKEVDGVLSSHTFGSQADPGSLMTTLLQGELVKDMSCKSLPAETILSVFSHASCCASPLTYKCIQVCSLFFCTIPNIRLTMLTKPKECLCILPLHVSVYCEEMDLLANQRRVNEVNKFFACSIRDNEQIQKAWGERMKVALSPFSPTSRDACLSCLLFSHKLIPDAILLGMWKRWEPKVREGFLRQLLCHPSHPMVLRWGFISLTTGRGHELFKNCDARLVKSFKRCVLHIRDHISVGDARFCLDRLIPCLERASASPKADSVKEVMLRCLYIITILLRKDSKEQCAALHFLRAGFLDLRLDEEGEKWRNWVLEKRKGKKEWELKSITQSLTLLHDEGEKRCNWVLEKREEKKEWALEAITQESLDLFHEEGFDFLGDMV